jgi:hypothetical protein
MLRANGPSSFRTSLGCPRGRRSECALWRPVHARAERDVELLVNRVHDGFQHEHASAGRVLTA